MAKPERELTKQLAGHDRLVCIEYRSLNGIDYIKLRTMDGKPLQLVKKSVFRLLERRETVGDEEGKRVLNCVMMRQILQQWQDRKDAIKAKKLEPKIRKPRKAA